jgi:precorrin-2 dehydrogenase/sirohydrochlorin ferrochelatase
MVSPWHFEPYGLSGFGEYMRYYPILVDLTGKKAVVVGGGQVGQRKIDTLLKHGAKVHLISRELSPQLKRYMEEGEITYLGSEFDRAHIDGAFLVIAATDDPSTNRAVSVCAQEKGVLVNAVDQPGDCTFIVPSILRRGDLIIAVSTSGKSPAMAKKIREDLENRYGQEYETFLALLGKLREDVLKMGLSQEENKGIFGRLVNSSILAMIRKKEWDGIALLLTEILHRPVSKERILEYLKVE